MEDSNDILELLEAVQSLQIVKCNMHHERVASDLNKNPIHKLQEDTLVFDRVSLCDASQRKLRLGCAHSSVNINFERTLDCLMVELPEIHNQILNLKNEFKTVVTEIYTLDHKVGHLEHDLAICKLTSNDKEEEAQMLTRDAFRLEHRALMTHLSRIKSDIEQLIKEQLKYRDL